jgi:hypothetical protein
MIGFYIAYCGNFTEKAQKETGFLFKISRGSEVEDRTFLHGTWLEFEPELGKPSRRFVHHVGKLLKMGKICRLMPGPDRLKEYAYCLAMCYGFVPANMPIVYNWQQMLLRVSGRTVNEKMYNELTRYKMPSEYGSRINEASYRAYLFSRYQITADEVSEICSLIDGVMEIPWFLGHPAFDRMSAVDYGQGPLS